MSWSLPPNFEANAQDKKQVFSALGHGQVLLNNTEHMLGLWLAPVVPTTHYPEYLGTVDYTRKWRRVWDGHIIKETDTFEYNIAAIKDAVLDYEIRIYYDEFSAEEEIPAGTGTVYVNDTIDISELTAGERYRVQVDARALSVGAGSPTSLPNNKIRPVYLVETDEQSYSTLADFLGDDTPTVKQWQALSDQQATLHSQFIAPRQPFLSESRSPSGDNDLIGKGCYIQHRHNLLAYDLFLESPYTEGTTRVEINLNGDTLKTLTANTGSDQIREKLAKTGTIDISGEGLTVGNDYYLEVKIFEADAGGDYLDRVRIFYVYEQASVQMAVSGWTDMVDFTPNQIMTGTADVAKVRDNIEWLTDRVTYRNHAVHNLRDKPYYYFWRFHHWLYFYVDDDDLEPKLEYWQGEWVEVSLQKKPGEWVLYQLTDAPVRLGGMYRLSGVTCAMEVYSA